MKQNVFKSSKTKSFLCLGLIAACVSAAGCAPGLGKTLDLRTVPKLEGQERRTLSLPNVRIEPFVDARTSQAVGTINSRELMSDGSVTQSVERAIEEEVKDLGAQVVSTGVPGITGKIIEWRVDVVPGFPSSEADGKATIEVEVRNADDKPLYHGVYSGAMLAEHPFLSQGDIEKTLGLAMRHAIREALDDQDLIRALGGYVVEG